MEYSDWKAAHSLLRYQISLKKDDVRTLRTLSFYFYEKMEEHLDRYSDEIFFDSLVRTNLFFLMDCEFSLFTYYVPKGRLGSRTYKVFSAPMRLIHYSIALYLARITIEFRKKYFVSDRISSYYGGLLCFNNDSNLVLKPETVIYKKHYQNFKKSLTEVIEGHRSDGYVIAFDIANFYNSISIPILMKLIQNNLSFGERHTGRFSKEKQVMIEDFYRFIMGNRGLPQADNDIASDFIANLFLSFVDLELEDLINHESHVLTYKIVRYVDDYYIHVELNPFDPPIDKKRYICRLAERISDLICEKVDLNINDKTAIYDLDELEDLAKLRDDVKRVSGFYEVPVEGDTVPEVMNRILGEVRQLKDDKNVWSNFEDVNFDCLKEVYDGRIKKYAEKKEVQIQLSEIFCDFPFELMKVAPKELTVLVSYHTEGWERYVQYLLTILKPSSRDTNLMILAASQTNFSNTDLNRKLESNPLLKKIFASLGDAHYSFNKLGPYDLSISEVDHLKQVVGLSNQWKYRAFAEQNGNYPLAINHLVNEIYILFRHWHLHKKKLKIKLKDITALTILDWLRKFGCTNFTVIGIGNLMDRRNNNDISHSVENADSISEEEYSQYVNLVCELVRKTVVSLGS